MSNGISVEKQWVDIDLHLHRSVICRIDAAGKLHDRRWGRCRTGRWGPGRRFEGGLALEPVAGHELADPALGDAVGTGYLGLGLAGQDSGDDKTTTCDTLCRCRETPHSDVLNQDTAPATSHEVHERASEP